MLSASGTQRSSVRERWRVPKREASSAAHVMSRKKRTAAEGVVFDIQMWSGTMDTPSPTWGTGLPGRPDAGKGGFPVPQTRKWGRCCRRSILGNGIHPSSTSSLCKGGDDVWDRRWAVPPLHPQGWSHQQPCVQPHQPAPCPSKLADPYHRQMSGPITQLGSGESAPVNAAAKVRGTILSTARTVHVGRSECLHPFPHIDMSSSWQRLELEGSHNVCVPSHSLAKTQLF
jgi:hypothetical protein